ncbi:signal transduction histidine kinase [Frigoribacterium sp. PhB107]|uniref:sensor histidine kinase n=1 Tax=Frigoribacterium sp. PhB107 TaxID=2485172 RepID=UPI000FAC67CF|nr:HAMP domain-containing sensor histidine kinase [Frigoribacterium sp. PhB107]ROP78912.1 signal transduction histidine kinase [Frigoribacterium sp. PhB107]
MADDAGRVGRGGRDDGGGRPTRTGRRGSLRLRITAAAVLAVALTLGAFALVFALVQQAVLADAPRSAASADVDRAVAALAGGSSPAVAVSGDADGALVAVFDAAGQLVATGGDDDLAASARQLAGAASGSRVSLDGDDFVVETDGAESVSTTTSTPSPSSSPSAGPSASPSPEPEPAESSSDDDDALDEDDAAEAARDAADDASDAAEDASAAAAAAAAEGDDDLDVETVTTRWDVVAARSLDEAQAASSASLLTLGVAVPVALLVLGVTTWFVVGRALRPVESMRREVAEVTAANLSHRLADPGGGDEVSRLASTLNGMLDRLDASATAQRRFVGDASHELKTPLATIRQHAEVALLHPERIDGRALAGTVLGEEARLTSLVQGLLVLARADEGALGVARRPVDLDDLVLTEAARLRSGAATGAGGGAASGSESTSGSDERVGRGVSVDATAVGPARVRGDEGLLGQVVRNLVVNASRHARSAVAVGLVETADGRAVLTVDDDGAGVATDDRGRIFERFVRLDEARDRDAGGSGLGLAIVAEIVRVHGGEVRVETSPLGGARFVVDLPADPA